MVIWTAALYVLARFEVTVSVLRQRRQSGSAGSVGPDQVPLTLIPSVRRGDKHDRVLAEIDQDGFLFASASCDIPLFNRRRQFVRRRYRKLQVILRNGLVCVRKLPDHKHVRGDLGDHIRDFLGWGFYLEAAALLRLQGISSIPTLRRLDLRNRIIEMDYIWGCNLRLALASEEGRASPCPQALASFHSRDLKMETKRVLAEVSSRGVVPLDVHPANFIYGQRSGSLYIVDFHLVFLRPIPGWSKHRELLERTDYL